MLGYIIWLLKEQKKERKNNSNGMMLLLRRQLMDDYDKYTTAEQIPSYAYENYLDMYNAYHALGGNGMITKMLDEINELHFKGKSDKNA